MKHLLRRFLADDKGVSMVEAALLLPLLVFIFAGMVEGSHYIMMHLKMQHTAIAIGDLITRDDEISEDLIDDLFDAAPQIMIPFEMTDNGVIIVSSVSRDVGDPAAVFWQRKGVGSKVQASMVGIEGGTAQLATGMVVDVGETVIITELYFDYEPLIFSIIPAAQILKVSYFRPRLGSLQGVQS